MASATIHSDSQAFLALSDGNEYCVFRSHTSYSSYQVSPWSSSSAYNGETFTRMWDNVSTNTYHDRIMCAHTFYLTSKVAANRINENV